ncbi:MAG: hypothetical protein E7441_00905 [Ruminococcaceae bacterium]|nr:hypothetical protein [Oscillospiraceae bacterium]
MGLFLEAAKCWNSLQNTSYCITFGKNKKLKNINLIFRDVDFDHLSGIHYADDVDFKLHRNEYRGDKLIPALLSQKLDDGLIEKSSNWGKISDRLSAVTNICDVLESNFTLYYFSPNRLTFHSTITAVYFLYSEQFSNGIFLFLDKEENCFYCKSVFSKDVRDYCINQTRLKVLKKTKMVCGEEKTLFVHPNFKETENVILTV